LGMGGMGFVRFLNGSNQGLPVECEFRVAGAIWTAHLVQQTWGQSETPTSLLVGESGCRLFEHARRAVGRASDVALLHRFRDRNPPRLFRPRRVPSDATSLVRPLESFVTLVATNLFHRTSKLAGVLLSTQFVKRRLFMGLDRSHPRRRVAAPFWSGGLTQFDPAGFGVSALQAC